MSRIFCELNHGCGGAVRVERIMTDNALADTKCHAFKASRGSARATLHRSYRPHQRQRRGSL